MTCIAIVFDMLVFPTMLERGGRNAGDQRMRVLAIIALATLLAGCEGNRIKQSKTPAPTIVAAVPCLVM
jgi:hypothetical protein